MPGRRDNEPLGLEQHAEGGTCRLPAVAPETLVEAEVQAAAQPLRITPDTAAAPAPGAPDTSDGLKDAKAS